MTDVEISKMLDIPLKTLADWKKKSSKRNKLYAFLSKMGTEEAQMINARDIEKEEASTFSSSAKSVVLKKSWFKTDLLWSSADGQRIGIDRLITAYMSKPEQRNTDKLIRLFGAQRVKAVIDKNFNNSDFEFVRRTANEQVNYENRVLKVSKIKKNITVNPLKLSRVIRGASQETIDRIYSKVGETPIVEATKMFKPKYPDTMIVKKQVEYAKSRTV